MSGVRDLTSAPAGRHRRAILGGDGVYPSARPSPLKIVAPTALDDRALRRYDYIGRKDPVTGEITCPWRKGRGKVQSGGSSGVQMAG